MAAAVPAAIGAGSSVVGGIKGKNAAKKQEKRANELFNLQKPLFQQQAQAATFANQQSRPYIRGAGQGLTDLMKNYYGPRAFGNRNEINKFLSPERRAINQGYQAMQKNVNTFAPRGGGRVSSMVNADMQRQGQLSDLVFRARNDAAQGYGQTSNQLGALGTGLLASGLSGGQQASSVLNNQLGIAQKASENSGDQLTSIGESLGGFLGGLDFFKGKSGTGNNAAVNKNVA